MHTTNYGSPYQDQPNEQLHQNQQAFYQGQPQDSHQQAYHNDAYTRPPMPKSYLAESILVIFLCCMPLGIIGLIKGQEVSRLYLSGHYERAQETSNSAKTWLLWGVGLGAIGGALYLIVFLLTLLC